MSASLLMQILRHACTYFWLHDPWLTSGFPSIHDRKSSLLLPSADVREVLRAVCVRVAREVKAAVDCRLMSRGETGMSIAFAQR